MKKLFSKRSGFTLAEIIVAFAVFAIMAAMLLQLLSLAIAQRASNNALSDSIEADREALASKDMNYDPANKTGELSMNFADAGIEIKMDYELRGPDGTKGDTSGVNYFLSNVDYEAAGQGSSGGAGADGGAGTGTGAQLARYDTRITGTKGFRKIQFVNVVKDTNPADLESGQTRYLFELIPSAVAEPASKADTDTEIYMAPEDIPYAQFRLYLFDSVKKDATKSAIEYTDAKTKKTYTKTVYQAADIVEVGYINSATLAYNTDGSCPRSAVYRNDGGYNPLKIERTSGNIIRIGVPFSGTHDDFPSGAIRFWVVFNGDPQLSVNSFGDNYTSEGGDGVSYTAYPLKDDTGAETGKNSVNIYGAFEYTKNYK